MKKWLLILGIFTLSLVSPIELKAQCPMCRMSAESNLKNGGTAGKGLNTGILYMLLTPYLLVGVLGYIYYRGKPGDGDGELDELIQIDQAQLN